MTTAGEHTYKHLLRAMIKFDKEILLTEADDIIINYLSIVTNSITIERLMFIEQTPSGGHYAYDGDFYFVYD